MLLAMSSNSSFRQTMFSWQRPRKGVTRALISDWWILRVGDGSMLDQSILVLPEIGAPLGLQGNSSWTDCGR